MLDGRACFLIHGDAQEALARFPDGTFDCCITSPPYWGLRDYGVDGQIGLERTPQEFVDRLVSVFREVRRVLRDDGTLWLNIGDTYATGAGKVGERPGGGGQGDAWKGHRGSRGGSSKQPHTGAAVGPATQPNRMPLDGLKPKDLIGIPWMLAFALRADGWYLRQDIIWSKPNPMPKSVRDRCTKSHEYIFLLSKSERYFIDPVAMSEPAVKGHGGSRFDSGKTADHQGQRMQRGPRFVGSKYGDNDDPRHQTKSVNVYTANGTRNRRSVWTIATASYKGAHFAVFPERLITPCVLAGSRPGGVVLDPFSGAGSTGVVVVKHARRYVGIDLNENYIEQSRQRIADAEPKQPPLFEEVR